MRVRRIKQEEAQPTHSLEVTESEMWAIRRASEAYVQDEYRDYLPFHKANLEKILKALNIELGEE